MANAASAVAGECRGILGRSDGAFRASYQFRTQFSTELIPITMSGCGPLRLKKSITIDKKKCGRVVLFCFRLVYRSMPSL